MDLPPACHQNLCALTEHTALLQFQPVGSSLLSRTVRQSDDLQRLPSHRQQYVANRCKKGQATAE